MFTYEHTQVQNCI